MGLDVTEQPDDILNGIEECDACLADENVELPQLARFRITELNNPEIVLNLCTEHYYQLYSEVQKIKTEEA